MRSDATELEKAVAFEAIRGRLPDVWTLLDIVESTKAPEHADDTPSHRTFAAREGWSVTFFYDVGELDYIDHIITSDNVIIDPWDWLIGAPGGNYLRCWGSVGCRARLMALDQRNPIRFIDCTDLAPDAERRVNEVEQDGIGAGRIEIRGGYLDWDASVIRRIPAPVKEAA